MLTLEQKPAMLHVLCFYLLNILIINSCEAQMDEPIYYLKSRGKVWPKPWQEKESSAIFDVDPTKIQFNVKCKNCTKILKAIQRCKDYIDILSKVTNRNHTQRYSGYKIHQNPKETLKELQIHLSQDCDEHPYFDMDESYNLTVSNISMLNSSSVWGIIRGMETFTQLFYLAIDYKNIFIKGAVIVDRPNYPHRALMLDTARHYLSIKTILKTLDAMAMNKMNVFHWHMVDDSSFPYQSTKLPGLINAVFHPSMTYTRSDLETVKNYASDLGIRVLMEIDMPGHSAYWEVSYPEIVTQCPYYISNSRPLFPLREKTYSILKELLQEIQEIFPDNYLHLGGDEVDFGCWATNVEIESYLLNHSTVDINVITALFYKNVFLQLKNGTIPVVWEEVFDSNVELPRNTLIQTWTGDGTDHMVEVLKKGFRGIQSAPYYLDLLDNGIELIYKNEPRLDVKEKLKNDTLLANLVGGTACMWGEKVDDTNVMSRVWPRATGLAEVLWSETNGTGLDEQTLLRIEEHTCRMRRRGVPAAPPKGSGFCII